jgi:ACDE family multidrug resistance protein
MTASETSVSLPDTAGVPWTSPALLAILAATLMTPMDVPLISAALPEIQAKFGVPESSAGLFITLYALPGILLAPVIGSLADRVGRRDVLVGSLVLFGSAGTAIAFTSDFTFAAGSILSALAMTVVGDRYTGRRHDAVMGVTSAMLSLGTAAYPVLGGILAARAWNAPFLLYALTLPVAGFVFIALDEQGPTDTNGGGGYLREALRLIPARRAAVLYGVMFASFTLVFGGIYTALPFYLTATFGFSPTMVGLTTSGVLLMTALVSTQNGRLATVASTATLLTAGFGLYAVGLLGVAVATTTLTLVGALLVFGVGSGLVTPTLFAGLSSLAPDRVRGGVMSLQTTTIGVSQAVGPALFTFLGGALGYQATLVGGSAGAALAAAIIAVVAAGL